MGGVTAANVASGANLANAATSANSAGALVLRDGSGSFSAGNFNLPSTLNASTGLITQNGNRFIHSFGTSNVFVGGGAGNFTTTGMQNTATTMGAALPTRFQTVFLASSRPPVRCPLWFFLDSFISLVFSQSPERTRSKNSCSGGKRTHVWYSSSR